EYQNRRGASMWQPATHDGARLWLVSSYATDGWELEWRYDEPAYENHRPKLFKSKARAERVARRRERKSARAEMDLTFTEVSDEHCSRRSRSPLSGRPATKHTNQPDRSEG